nr:MAG TPA: hypothetical protein [Caudoviricetes sp.]
MNKKALAETSGLLRFWGGNVKDKRIDRVYKPQS